MPGHRAASRPLLLLLCAVSATVLMAVNTRLPLAAPKAEMLLCMGAAFLWFLFGLKKDSCRADRICSLILILGLVMRVGYMLYTPYNCRSHDAGSADFSAGGHSDYLLNLLLFRRLPGSYDTQYYQQPLHYLLSALGSIPVNLLCGNLPGPSCDAELLVNGCRIVPCLFSCGMLLLTDVFCDDFRLRGPSRAFALAMTAFTPALWLVCGIEPDAAAGFMLLWSILCVERWFRDPSWKHTLAAALAFGLGVMVKISCALTAPLMLAAMLYRLIRAAKEGRAAGILGRCAVFALISLPLGLWYNVRNLVLFGMPLGYVLPQPEDGVLYTGMHSVAERLLPFDFSSLLRGLSPAVSGAEDYNLPAFLLKTSLFGEFGNPGAAAPGVAVYVLACLLSPPVVFGLLSPLWQKENRLPRLYLAGCALLILLSAVLFSLRYPFFCSMDFRYFIPLVPLLGLLCGFALENSPRLRAAAWPLLALFSAASCLLYTLPFSL